jgi:hypothetical protein
MVIGAMQAIDRVGLRCPQDVANRAGPLCSHPRRLKRYLARYINSSRQGPVSLCSFAYNFSIRSPLSLFDRKRYDIFSITISSRLELLSDGFHYV